MQPDDPANVNYRELRETIGAANSQAIMDQGGRFRRKLRLAFDTMVWQYCANDRVKEHEVIVESGPWSGVRQIFRETVAGPKPKGRGDDADELSYIYALCELGRHGDAEILTLPIISTETKHRRHRSGHGAERLDYGVPFTPYPIICKKMKYSSSRILNNDPDDECLRDVAHYGPLLAHLKGDGQRKDVRAYMEADIADADVFISLDGKFINPFRQIESKLRENGVRTLVMRPSEFCKEANLRPIPFPPPHPRQSMGTSPPER